jgi:Mg2+ and Co2+ transporter CorA
MDVRWIAPTGIEARDWSDVPALLARDDGFVWVDILACDTAMARQLAETFGFHDLALRDIVERNHVPKLHAYPTTSSWCSMRPRRPKPGTSTSSSSTSSSGRDIS